VGILTTEEATNVRLLSQPSHRILGGKVGEVEKGGEEIVFVASKFEILSESKDSSVCYSTLVDILSYQYAANFTGVQ
jgi:hypothetical protein